MKLKFDHKHYIPVMRFRRGEKVAMRELGTQARSGITPLLEIVPITDYSPRTVADEIRTHWGPYPFFLDLQHLPESQDGSLVIKMDEAMGSHGLLIIGDESDG